MYIADISETSLYPVPPRLIRMRSQDENQNEITSARAEIRSQSISWVITLIVTSDPHIGWGGDQLIH